MKDFCIIGSGISGATIANSLSKKYSLDIYDKARGAGGRSSNKNSANMKALIMAFNTSLQRTSYLKDL